MCLLVLVASKLIIFGYSVSSSGITTMDATWQ